MIHEPAAQTLNGRRLPHRSGPRPRAVAAPTLDESLGTVAHELRGPLAALFLGMEAIADTPSLDQAARDTLSLMQHQVRQATRLIDDVYDLCAGGLGKLSLEPETVVAADAVARAAAAVAGPLAARRHRLTVSLPADPLTLEADPLRLNQILTNLLANAAKFTDPGGHIGLSAAAEAGQVVFRVRDNGRGIAPEQLPRVFDLFHQSPSRFGATGGLGVGLALVKALVDRHGGSVAARSDGPGAGTEFIVRLPARGDEPC